MAGNFCEMAEKRPTITPTGVVSMSLQNFWTAMGSYHFVSAYIKRIISKDLCWAYGYTVVTVELHLFPNREEDGGQ
jgi:hypothetical protein